MHMQDAKDDSKKVDVTIRNMGVTAHRLLKSISVAQGVLIPEVIDAACYALLEILRAEPTTSVRVLARRFRSEDIIMPQVVL